MPHRDPKSGPSEMRLYCMFGGTCSWDQGVFTHMQGVGTRIEAPIPIFLIDHPEGKVLFETGLHPQVAIDAEGHWGKERTRDLNPKMNPEQSVERQLKEIGITPEDIRYVILSVLLPDHAGGMQAFPDATFIVQFRELQDAWWPDKRIISAYDFKELLPTRNFNFWELHDEDLDVFGDGSVEVLFSPAHTCGEQALVVRLPKTGTVVLPAGVIPQRANLERRVTTGTPRVDPKVVHASMERLRRVIEQERATVFFHHDPEEWKKIKQLPKFYE